MKSKWHVSGSLADLPLDSPTKKLSNEISILMQYALEVHITYKIQWFIPTYILGATDSGRSWTCVLSQMKLTTLFCFPDHFLVRKY
jgi:hypothetical protein